MSKDVEGSFCKEMASEVLDFCTKIILVKVPLNYGIQGGD